ncbi:MAG TPA: cyclic nucleotide-binding domain-containing protein [Candidatus Latescibacteria bacterium]|nr:cyclic nucleotide-binding domain-containing protein [Candidatus Latescibacterota bacterium]
MPSDPFWSNIFRRRDKEEADIFDILKKVPIFQDLGRREFNKIESILHRRNWNADEVIINEGAPGVGMYIIVAGEVRITQVGEDGVQQQLAILTGGDFFGEQALLDESPRTASAYASETCKIIGFFRPDLLELIESNPRLGLKIVMRLSKMISVRLRRTNRLLKEARMRVKQVEEESKGAELEQRETEGEEAGAISS